MSSTAWRSRGSRARGGVRPRRLGLRGELRLAPAVQRGPGDAQGLAHRSRRRPRGADLGDGRHQSSSSSARGSQGDPQDLGNFFLDLDDRLGLLQLPLQPRVLTLQLLHPRIHGLAASARASARSQPGQRPLLPLAAPRRQVRGVQPLAPQQRADLAGRLARVRLPQDPQLVLRAEAPTLRLRRHLGVGRPPPPSAETPVALRAPSVSAATSFLTTQQGLGPSLQASPPPTLNSNGYMSHLLLAQGASPKNVRVRRASASHANPEHRANASLKSEAASTSATPRGTHGTPGCQGWPSRKGDPTADCRSRRRHVPPAAVAQAAGV